MKVTELSNQQLDYWVAKAQGWLFCSPDGWDSWCDVTGITLHDVPDYRPSTNWQHCGELAGVKQIVDVLCHKMGYCPNIEL